MSLAGANDLKPTGRPVLPTLKNIREWILETPVEELAQLVFDGVDLENPPWQLLTQWPPPPPPPLPEPDPEHAEDIQR